MITVHQFRYNADNLGYVISTEGRALAIDGGAEARILEYLSQEGLTLELATNTHNHPDHTQGTRNLVRETGARYLDHRSFLNGKPGQTRGIRLGGQSIEVFPTPGHTADSVCFYQAPYLFSGDTLFNGSVGKCFSGDTRAFYQSIVRLRELPPETVVYAGHDYVEETMALAYGAEPENHQAQTAYEKKYDFAHVYSTIAGELSVNPFFRTGAPAIVRMLEKRGLDTSSDLARFQALLQLK